MAADDVRRVFVYGSLLHEPSLLQTLAHRTGPPPSEPFVLDGWERAWQVVSARTFALADDPTGPIHRRLVLGIRPATGSSCAGVVFDLVAADLDALAPREAAYELAEVTTDRRDPIWSFVPRPDRVRGAAPVHEPLVVEATYLEACRAGIAAHGLDAAAEEMDRALVGLVVATALRPAASDGSVA
jgi:hypothetical protein